MGFRATTPHSAAGLRVEPPVSEPKALSGMDQTVNYNFLNTILNQIYIIFGTVSGWTMNMHMNMIVFPHR